MLVSHHKVGGFRQVVLRGGRLIFTRLAQSVEDSNPEVIAGSVEQEILNTIEYLKRLSYTPKSGLDIFIVVEQEVRSVIARDRFAATHLHTYTPFEAAELLGLKQAVLSGDRFGDVVIAASLGMARKRSLRMQTEHPARLNQLYFARTALRFGMMCLCLGLLGYCILQSFSLQAISSAYETLQGEDTAKKKQLADIQLLSKSFPADVEEVTDVLGLYRELDQEKYGLLDLARDLGGILNDKALVQSLDWKADYVLKEQAVPKTPVYAPPHIPLAPAKPTPPAIVANVNLQLIYDDKDWPSFVARAEQFAAGFGGVFSQFKVEHSSLPGQFESSEVLEINFDEQSDKNSGPQPGERIPVKVTLSGPVTPPPAAANPAGVPGAPAMPRGAAPMAGGF